MTPENSRKLDLLSTFHYVVGGIMALFSCMPLIHVFMGLMIVSGKLFEASSNQPPTPDGFGWIFVIMGSVFVLCGWTLSILILIAGRKLKKRQSLMFCTVIGGLECLFMPLGTVLGVFTLITLTNEEIKQEYLAESPEKRYR